MLLVVFPVAVGILVGVLGHSVNLGIKTFLLIECGMAVLSPLLNAVINDGNHRITTVENSLHRAEILEGFGDHFFAKLGRYGPRVLHRRSFQMAPI